MSHSRKALAVPLMVTALVFGACSSTGATPTAVSTPMGPSAPASTPSAMTATQSQQTVSSPSSPDASSCNTNGKTYNIAFVPGELPLPFYNAMEAGVKKETAKFGMTVTVQASSDFVAEHQIPVLQALLAHHPDGLIVTPVDENALMPVVQQYYAANIPVITTDERLADPSGLVSQIDSNNKAGGAQAADYLANLVGGKGEVGVIEIGPGVTTTLERGGGFIDEIKAKYPNMTVIGVQYNQNSETTAESLATSMIIGHPNMIGIFQAAGGVGDARAVLDTHTLGKVFAVGYDSSPAETDLLKQGALKADVLQKPYDEGVMAVDYMCNYLTGNKAVIQKQVSTDTVLATTENVNDPAISQYFYYNY